MTNPGEMRQEPQPAFFRTSLTGFGKQLCEALPVTFGCRELSSTSHTVSYYDSFEWNAWKKKRVIRKKGAKLSLLDLDSGHETASCPLRSTPTHIHPGRTSHDSVRELLSGLSALRAFIRLCRLEEQTTQLHITNDNEKTVAVVALTVMTLREKQREPFSITLLSVSPLRGYGNEARQLTGELLRAGLLSEETSFPDVYRELLSAAGLTPGAYSSKPSVRLDPGEPIHNSALKLLMATFRVMQANEPWLSKDLDTEFLHDYRVAIRRTRSVLAQLKGIFPSADTERFKNEFRQLAKRTNDLRDQDVYLLAAPSLKAMLPPPLQPGLDTFLDDLRAAHKNELGKLRRYLRSRHHAELLHSWEAFLTEPQQCSPDDPPDASRPTASLAVDTIRKAWKKVLRHGRNISTEATDEELHGLRLDCKKLRYLLEFFVSLFPEKVIGPVIGHLKQLQDNLGVFVDLSVQQEYLYGYLSEKKQHPDYDALSRASIGGLITALYHEREHVRKRFHATFSHFDSEETAELFSRLFQQYR
jgi:CHAD domain-containing protein